VECIVGIDLPRDTAPIGRNAGAMRKCGEIDGAQLYRRPVDVIPSDSRAPSKPPWGQVLLPPDGAELAATVKRKIVELGQFGKDWGH
jgi:hypothetical protein